MSVQVGYQTLVGHSGVIEIAAAQIDATIETLDVEVSWTETELHNGVGTLTGIDARNVKLAVTLTFRPNDALTTPTLQEAPAPGTEVTLSGFNAPGTQVGESDVNGVFFYEKGYSARFAAGQVLDVTLPLKQTAALPT